MQFAIGADHVFAQEGLVRGIRSVGLILVNERRRRVDVLVDVVGRSDNAVGPRQHCRIGGARQQHEVGRAALNVKGIVRQQRDEYRARTALRDEVEPVIEELAEERHPRVEGRR